METFGYLINWLEKVEILEMARYLDVIDFLIYSVQDLRFKESKIIV